MKWFKRRPQPDPTQRSVRRFNGGAIEPEQRFIAIGDVHGCCDLLSATLQQIEDVVPDVPIVFVGDYVDRGEQSAQTLRLLTGLSKRDPEKFICLRGNHEEMMLQFLDAPAEHGRRWMRHGGLQTLASFGVGGVHEGARGETLVAARDALIKALGEELIGWLHQLPRKWMSGNVAVVHAGADPNLPIDQQPDHALTWGHSDFLSVPRQDGIWVVHGHTIVSSPAVVQGRIEIDTGAYATGRLTAVGIEHDSIDFLQI